MNPAYPVDLFPPGQHPALQPPRGRKRKAPRQVGNVVPFRRDLDALALQLLRGANTSLDRQERSRAREALCLARAMEPRMLDAWLAIGAHMLDAGRARP